METLRDLDLVRAVPAAAAVRDVMPGDGEAEHEACACGCGYECGACDGSEAGCCCGCGCPCNGRTPCDCGCGSCACCCGVEQTDPEMASEQNDAGYLGLLTVRFSPFNTWYEINDWWEGEFLERTSPGAFTKTMRESGGNVRCQFDHGYDPSIGSKVLCAPESLREDTDSAVLEGRLFDTSYNRDLIPGLRAGCYGSSFRFRVIKEEWNDEPGPSTYNPRGLPERTILEVRLFEAGPVTWPANPAATAAARSLTSTYYEQLRSRDPRRVEELADRVRSIRTPAGAAAARTVPAQGAALHDLDEPAQTGHSSGLTARQRRALIHPFLTKGAVQ